MNAKQYADKIWGSYMSMDTDDRYIILALRNWATRIADIPDSDCRSDRAANRKDAALLILERL